MSKKRNKSLDLRSWNHRMFYTLVSKMTKTMNNQSSFTTKFLSINKSTMFAALACTLLLMQRLHLIIHHLKCPYIWECFLFPLPCSSSRNMRKPWSTSELFSGTSRGTSRLWTWRNSSTRPWRKVTINLESQHNSSIASVIVKVYEYIYTADTRLLLSRWLGRHGHRRGDRPRRGRFSGTHRLGCVEGSC